MARLRHALGSRAGDVGRPHATWWALRGANGPSGPAGLVGCRAVRALDNLGVRQRAPAPRQAPGIAKEAAHSESRWPRTPATPVAASRSLPRRGGEQMHD